MSTIYYQIKKDIELESYRNYMAGCARILTENTAKFAGGNYMTMEYDDVIHPKPKDNRTADDIVNELIEKAGIGVRD